MTRRLMIAACAFVALEAVVALPPAVADGPPQGVLQDGEGVTSPDDALRYLAIANQSSTLLEALRVRGGMLMNSVWLHGAFAIPAVSWTATGISADGKTLVLTTYPWITSSATFVVLRVPDFTKKRVVHLKGAWSFD